jgi:erythromycin esterase-like protein
MWRNKETLNFVEWLREHNEKIGGADEGCQAKKAGFYGMDVYSLASSAHAVLSYLDKVDPEGAKRAKARYACFDGFTEDAMNYAVGLATGKKDCANQALAEMLEVRKKAPDYLSQLLRQGLDDKAKEMTFSAVVNAEVVKGAENYYRNMFFREELTWNIRDTHMLQTVKDVEKHLRDDYGIEEPKIAIWAHNSHLGDARATDMGKRRGEVNLGQLMRETYGEQQTFIMGFTTHTGTVAAADEWDHPVQRKRVLESMRGSYERLLHEVHLPRYALKLRDAPDPLAEILTAPQLERFIGVIYRPDTERWSHYSTTSILDQFDMVIHFDRTSAVSPLEKEPDWAHLKPGDTIPETYPFGV